MFENFFSIFVNMVENLQKRELTAGLTLGAANIATEAVKWLKKQGFTASKTAVVSEAVIKYWMLRLEPNALSGSGTSDASLSIADLDRLEAKRTKAIDEIMIQQALAAKGGS